MSIGAVVLLSFASGAEAQQPSITVSGTGEVLARPDCLEIDVRAAASAEITGDAVVKYQDALRRIQGALAKLGMKELTIEQRDLRFASGDDESGQGPVFVVQPQPAAAAKSTIHVTRSLRLLVRGIDKLSEVDMVGMISKLLDTAKDAGAIVGRSTGSNMFSHMVEENGDATAVVHFIVENAEELREEAYRKAFAEAKTRAQRLARLAGARLGKAISVDETETSVMTVYGAPTAGHDKSRLSSDRFTDIPVRVTLRVQFALDDEKPEDAKPEKGSVHAAP
ncbi:MAG TPA: SIMPL domain-containing protein [Pirellulales bacterium]|nr:SIMPL domain-containing protein [Pirellulales bacterium]